jgi:putative endonuclease
MTEEYIRVIRDILTDSDENWWSPWCVYILRSQTNPNLMYCGMTNNIYKRLRQHNGLIKGGGKYTSANRPWHLSAIIPADSHSDALKIEYWTKAKNYPAGTAIPRNDPVTRRKWLILSSLRISGLPDDAVEYFDSQFD